MRLFCASSSASPFCTCKSHTLPPSTPEMERIWRSMPDETQNNLFLEAGDEEDMRTLFVSNIPSFPSSPFMLHTSLLSFKTAIQNTPWKSADDSLSDNSSVSELSILSPPRSFSALNHSNEPDCVRAAHAVYENAFSGDHSVSDMYVRVEELIRMSSNVNISTLRSTLRKITMLSFNEMWKSRSELWTYVESMSHPCTCVYPTSLSSVTSHKKYADGYGTPARKLASFAGILFAHEVLNMSDLCSCIDQLRNRSTCVALQALHDLILYAGDKSCKSKNREYMSELYAEQKRRVITQEFALDKGVENLILRICAIISTYFLVQTGKRERGVKPPNKCRRQKVSLMTWGTASHLN